jgi:hypothetical protein
LEYNAACERENTTMAKEPKPRAVVENRIEVAASPEVLWTCFADVDKWSHWFPALVEVEWTSGVPWTLGARFRQTIKFGFPFGIVSGSGTVVEVSAVPYVAWQGRVMGVEASHGFHFEATANGTEVLSRHEYYGSRALLARLLLLTRRVHKIYQAALEGLKAYIEKGTIQLRMPM